MAEKITAEARNTLAGLHAWSRILIKEPAFFNALAAKVAVRGSEPRKKLYAAFELARQIRRRDPQTALDPVVKAAAAVHAHLGAKQALSFLHAALYEMHTGEALPLQPIKRPRKEVTLPKRVLVPLLRLSGRKPSEVFAEVSTILDKTSKPLSRKALKHIKLLHTATSTLVQVQDVAHAHAAISEKTGLAENDIHQQLLPLYDKAHEKIGKYNLSEILEILESLANGPLNKIGLQKAVKLLSGAVDEVGDEYKKRHVKANAGNTAVFSNVLQEIGHWWQQKAKPATVAKLEEALKKHVAEYKKRGY
ncbi:hypothetical protein HY571_00735 [Candidatus Micrarchaeota archaeon]|nr:hypothetical protein [Candidatus Micrarchaeota archaeon]